MGVGKTLCAFPCVFPCFHVPSAPFLVFPMKQLSKWIFIIALILLVPLVPFLLWEEPIEQGIRLLSTSEFQNPVVVSLIAIGLFLVDLFLPIPSSVVSVLTTHSLSSNVHPPMLGMLLAIFVIWLGMTLGALLAWAIGKLGGEALTRRFVGEKDFLLLQSIGERYGATVLVLLRAVPLFAEASVLMLSLSGVRFWRTFFWPIALSNLGIAAIYALLGSAQNGLPLWAIFVASIALPAIITLVAKIVCSRITRP